MTVFHPNAPLTGDELAVALSERQLLPSFVGQIVKPSGDELVDRYAVTRFVKTTWGAAKADQYVPSWSEILDGASMTGELAFSVSLPALFLPNLSDPITMTLTRTSDGSLLDAVSSQGSDTTLTGRFLLVKAGDVTVTVTRTGFKPLVRVVRIEPGLTARLEGVALEPDVEVFEYTTPSWYLWDASTGGAVNQSWPVPFPPGLRLVVLRFEAVVTDSTRRNSLGPDMNAVLEHTTSRFIQNNAEGDPITIDSTNMAAYLKINPPFSGVLSAERRRYETPLLVTNPMTTGLTDYVRAKAYANNAEMHFWLRVTGYLSPT